MTTLKFIAFLAMIIGAYALVTDPEDNSHEWAQSQNLKDLQAAQAGSARQQAAGQALCTEARGPNSEARWTPDGDLVCTTHRGVRQAAL